MSEMSHFSLMTLIENVSSSVTSVALIQGKLKTAASALIMDWHLKFGFRWCKACFNKTFTGSGIGVHQILVSDVWVHQPIGLAAAISDPVAYELFSHLPHFQNCFLWAFPCFELLGHRLEHLFCSS